MSRLHRPRTSPAPFASAGGTVPASPAANGLAAQSPPSHLSPAVQPHFSWQYIWSFFVRAPRVRAWLFQREPPPQYHVVHSLMSSPMLLGYVFSSSHESTRDYAFPDIGDLQTVFCRDGDTVLGFHFGFKGINPIMPLLFQVIKDPVLGNPTVIARRTARQRAPFPHHNHYFGIEFNWFTSGILSVVTSVHPVDADDERPTGLCPYILRADHRVFSRRTARNLSAIADSLAQQADLAFFPHMTDLPPDFLDPPDDYYQLSIREPDDPVYHATLQPAYVPSYLKTQTFEVEKDFPMSTATTANSTTTTTTSNTSNTSSTNNSNNTTPANTVLPDGDVEGDICRQVGAALHRNKGEVTAVAEQGTVKLWSRYQDKVAQSRRTGIIITMLSKKIGGRFAKEEKVFGRESRYMFLSTSGINVHGRIQRLFSQLNIGFGSPLPDRPLLSGIDAEVSESTKEKSELESAVDLTVGHQGMQVDSQQWTARRGLGGATMLDHGQHTSTAGIEVFTVEDGAARNRCVGNVERNASFSSDKPSDTSDKRANVSSDGSRLRKRRRTADVTNTTTESLNHHDGAVQAASRPWGRQTSVRNGWGAREQETVSLPRPKQEPMEDGPTQRRSFHLTNILSDNSLHISNEAEGSSSARGSSAQTSSGGVGASLRIKFEADTGPSVTETDEGRPVIAGCGGKDGTRPAKEKGAKTVWTCDRCGQQIRGKKGNLNRHIANKHENVRAFACDKPNCGRKFQTRLNLIRHDTAVHLGRPYACPSCPRAFKVEDDMKAHIKSAHEDQELKLACEVCGSCFGRRSTLNRHMAKVHKPKEERIAVVI